MTDFFSVGISSDFIVGSAIIGYAQLLVILFPFDVEIFRLFGLLLLFRHSAFRLFGSNFSLYLISIYIIGKTFKCLLLFGEFSFMLKRLINFLLAVGKLRLDSVKFIAVSFYSYRNRSYCIVNPCEVSAFAAGKYGYCVSLWIMSFIGGACRKGTEDLMV